MKIGMMASVVMLSLAAASGLAAQATSGDKAVTEDGSSLNGVFTGVAGGKVKFRETAAGDITLDPSKLKSVTLGAPRTVWYQPTKHDTLLRGTIRGGRMTEKGFMFDANQDGGADLDPLAAYKLSFAEYSLWTFTGNAGASALYSDGNSDELNYGAFLSMKWEHPVHIFEVQGSANFGKKSGVFSTQRARLDLNYTWRFSETLGAFARQTFEHDHFQQLKIRSTSSLGVRAFLVDDGATTVTFDGGVSYIEEHFKNGVSGRDYLAAMFAVDASHRFNERTVGVAGARTTLSLEKASTAIVHTYAGVNTTLMANLTAGVRMEWDWVAEPAPGVDRTDFRLTFLLGWTFA